MLFFIFLTHRLQQHQALAPQLRRVVAAAQQPRLQLHLQVQLRAQQILRLHHLQAVRQIVCCS